MIKEDKNNKQTSNIAKYSATAFQMLATIGVFVFSGYKIDQYQKNERPIFTAVLGLLGVVVVFA